MNTPDAQVSPQKAASQASRTRSKIRYHVVPHNTPFLRGLASQHVTVNSHEKSLILEFENICMIYLGIKINLIHKTP